MPSTGGWLDLRRLPLSSGPSRPRPPPARTPAPFLSQCTHKCKGALKERFSWLVGTRRRRGFSQLIVPSELLPLPPQRQPVLPRNLQGPSRHPAPLNRSLATHRSARQSTSQNSTHTSDRQDEADATGYGRQTQIDGACQPATQGLARNTRRRQRMIASYAS